MLLLRQHRAASDGSAYVFVRLDRLAELGRRQEAGTLRPRQRILATAIERFHALQRRTFGKDTVLGSLHDCRKTFCTHAAQVVPMHVLKEYAGHSKIDVTAKFYATSQECDAVRLREAMQGSLRLAS